MAVTFTGNVRITVGGTLTNTDSDLQTTTSTLSYSQTHNITNGTGADQANMVWSDTRTLTASASESLDLAGGLTDGFGSTITFTKIKGIVINAASANTNNVLVGGAASNQFINWVSDATDVIVVRPGASFVLMAPDSTGFAVTAGTGDLLKVANSAGTTSVTYDIILIGCV